MKLAFTNRVEEIQELTNAVRASGLTVVFGRRRVGKTRLLTHWLPTFNGLYSQAIEASRGIQLEQVMQDIGPSLKTEILPKTWIEFLELLSLHPSHQVLCLDEFPYLVASDPTLPSVLQRWLDHHCAPSFTLILAGSSNRAMNDCFLNQTAPLYQRARKLIHIEPMSYRAFCQTCGLTPDDVDSFCRFSLVGGIPKYWEFVESGGAVMDLAEELFFGRSAFLEDEPARTLRDEGIAGLNPLSILEAVGRGAEKPSEIAARLGTAQTNLSRTLQQLLDASILAREIPFGESMRSPKRTRYRIQDPALRFWFCVYSPHRTRWRTYDREQQEKLIHDHASAVFEDWCRMRHPEAARYWEPQVEFDFVREEQARAVVSEVKFTRLTSEGRRQHAFRLQEQWRRSALAKRYSQGQFEVLDTSILAD